MRSTYAEGRSFSIVIDDGVVTCRVWVQPDIDWEAGARLAAEISQALQALAAGPREAAKALVLDERDAPPVVGPRTQALIGDLLSAWERRGRRIAYALGTNPVKHLQMRRLVAQWAPKQGRTFESIDEARAWALEAPGAGLTPAGTKRPTPTNAAPGAGLTPTGTKRPAPTNAAPSAGLTPTGTRRPTPTNAAAGAAGLTPVATKRPPPAR
ncbi:MAG TPA: hypothetical protein VFS00_34320 [Polyangiaceae bacterium]|nr:hypothetical protein [Polyangiaceae bacterium]